MLGNSFLIHNLIDESHPGGNNGGKPDQNKNNKCGLLQEYHGILSLICSGMHVEERALCLLIVTMLCHVYQLMFAVPCLTLLAYIFG